MFAYNERSPVGRATVRRRLLRLVALAMVGFVGSVAAADGLRFSLVKTAQSDTRGEFAWRRGGWEQPPPINHLAILIEHRGSRLLFGTGLGRQIDAQLDAEMPWRIKRYGTVQAVRDQLERDGLGIDRILLGCVRWEHASGLVDYPEVPVLASAQSLRYLRAATPPAVLPSQFRHAIRWQTLRFSPKPYLGYAQSLDLFGDGQLVLVPLRGHGALGLFLALADGRRFFFRGDTHGHPDDQKAPSDVVALQDARTQAALGFYPRWVE
ncbi:Zn-dependent hydrolase [Stutzerimonas stutzeri]|uniref:Zn-dependent hydrolase n=1 Tax=Stutzerimonas sp. S1 TaxID=3030652 RepID=UPI002225542E|nr:Zn-dependent hydrolase [Stutzerimonas sp. S1]MCW3149174.1 Zn-dependent hydrolase [Stutzerimonas sp. S1]